MDTAWSAQFSLGVALGLPIVWIALLSYLRRNARVRHADVLVVWALGLSGITILMIAAALGVISGSSSAGAEFFFGVIQDIASLGLPLGGGWALGSLFVLAISAWLGFRLAVVPWMKPREPRDLHAEELIDGSVSHRRPRRVRGAIAVVVVGTVSAWLIPPVAAIANSSPPTIIVTYWLPDRALVRLAAEQDLQALRDPLPSSFVDLFEHSPPEFLGLPPIAAELERRRHTLSDPARQLLLRRLLLPDGLHDTVDDAYAVIIQMGMHDDDPSRLLVRPASMLYQARLPDGRWGRFSIRMLRPSGSTVEWSLPFGGVVEGTERSTMYRHWPAVIELDDASREAGNIQLKSFLVWYPPTGRPITMRSSQVLDLARVRKTRMEAWPERFVASMLSDPAAWHLAPDENILSPVFQSQFFVLSWRTPDARAVESPPGIPMAAPIAAAKASGLTIALRFELIAEDGSILQTRRVLGANSQDVRSDERLRFVFDRAVLDSAVRLRVSPDPEIARLDFDRTTYWTGEPIEIPVSLIGGATELGSR